jgi:hypothetical protein
MAARTDNRATSRSRGGIEVHAPPRETTSEDDVASGPALPEPRRSYVVPLAIAIAVFVILIAARTFWGMSENPRMTSPAPAETEAPISAPATSP